jgi:23S rRNA (guanosine2251-2'-O)-methyltransferase
LKKKNRLYIYGRQPVFEAVKAEYPVEQIWIATDLDGHIINKIKEMAERRSVEIRHIPKNDLQEYVGAVVHQGVAAAVEPLGQIGETQFQAFLSTTDNPLILILDQIQDPHNLGAIIRSAEIAGIDLIVLPEKGSAELNATVVKTSAGAVFYTKFYLAAHLEETIEQLNDRGISTAATVAHKGESLFLSNLSGPLALVIGGEGKGVRRHLERLCTLRLSIPQFGKINSLNASVASAVVIFEAVRQRHFKNDRPK